MMPRIRRFTDHHFPAPYSGQGRALASLVRLARLPVSGRRPFPRARETPRRDTAAYGGRWYGDWLGLAHREVVDRAGLTLVRGRDAGDSDVSSPTVIG